jgi:hypothetical protein
MVLPLVLLLDKKTRVEKRPVAPLHRLHKSQGLAL